MARKPFLIILLSLMFFIAEITAFYIFERTLRNILVRYSENIASVVPDDDAYHGLFAHNKLDMINNIDEHRVYILGGSTAQAFFSPLPKYQAEVKRKIVDLTVPTQTLFEKFMLIEAIAPQSKTGIVILTIHPLSFFFDTEEAMARVRYFLGRNFRYGIDNQGMEQFYLQNISNFIPHANWRILREANLYLALINQLFFDKLVLKRKLFEDVVDYDQRPAGSATLSESQRITKMNNWVKRAIRNQEIGGKLATKILNTIAASCKTKNLRLVILELPTGDIYRQLAASTIEKYNEKITAFLSTNPQVEYGAIPSNIFYGKEDIFSDSIHCSGNECSVFRKPFLAWFKQTRAYKAISPDNNVRSNW